MLYLRDGIYPAFRVRSNAPEGGWLADIVSEQPLTVYEPNLLGQLDITSNDFSTN